MRGESGPTLEARSDIRTRSRATSRHCRVGVSGCRAGTGAVARSPSRPARSIPAEVLVDLVEEAKGAHAGGPAGIVGDVDEQRLEGVAFYPEVAGAA